VPAEVQQLMVDGRAVDQGHRLHAGGVRSKKKRRMSRFHCEKGPLSGPSKRSSVHYGSIPAFNHAMVR
jgi:hypothetical protein